MQSRWGSFGNYAEREKAEKHVSNAFNVDRLKYDDGGEREHLLPYSSIYLCPQKLKHCNFIYFASNSLSQNVASMPILSVSQQRLLIKCVPVDFVAKYELLMQTSFTKTCIRTLPDILCVCVFMVVEINTFCSLLCNCNITFICFQLEFS